MNKNNDLVNVKRNELFKEYFGVGDRFFMDELTSSILSRYEFDVIKFDQWCQDKHGYDEENGSCSDFVAEKWGEDCRKFIESLLVVS